MKFLYFLSFLTFLLSCNQDKPKNNSHIIGPLTAIIEILAVTNLNYESNQIELETINYLPYPENSGFIKDTYMDPLKVGEGDALDVLLISPTAIQGSSIQFKPLGMIKLLDNGKEDHKIIAVPTKNYNTIFEDSIPSSVKNILNICFSNCKGGNIMKFI